MQAVFPAADSREQLGRGVHAFTPLQLRKIEVLPKLQRLELNVFQSAQGFTREHSKENLSLLRSAAFMPLQR